MKNGELSSFRHKVAETEMYKSLSQVVKKITMARNQMTHLKHGYTVAKNIGYTKWEKQSGFSERNKIIIKELIEQDGL